MSKDEGYFGWLGSGSATGYFHDVSDRDYRVKGRDLKCSLEVDVTVVFIVNVHSRRRHPTEVCLLYLQGLGNICNSKKVDKSTFHNNY